MNNPIIKSVEVDVRFHDDEHALSDFVTDLENLAGHHTLIDHRNGEDVSEAFLPMVRQLLDAIQAAKW